MTVADWIAQNIIWLMTVAVGCGVILTRIELNEKTRRENFAEIMRRFDEQDERTRDFWQNRWPMVERTIDRVDRLEKDVDEVKLGVHHITHKVVAHIASSGRHP